MKLPVLILLLAASCLGQMEGSPENWCREGFFTRDSKFFNLGIVKPVRGGRAYFYDDGSAKCPDDPSCRKKTYIVPGDKVVINRVRGDFACTWYVPAKGAPTIGWLRASDVDRPAVLLDTSEAAWTGEWNYAGNSISISPHKLGGYLNIFGEASWQGSGENIHIGELNGRFEHKKGVIEYSDGKDEYDCRATLRLLGSYLIVGDNLHCGGANVSFSGIYLKKNAKALAK